MSRGGLTYFGEGGHFMSNINDLKQKQIIGRSISSRNEIININNKKRFAHKWEKRILQLQPNKLHSNL